MPLAFSKLGFGLVEVTLTERTRLSLGKLTWLRGLAPRRLGLTLKALERIVVRLLCTTQDFAVDGLGFGLDRKNAQRTQPLMSRHARRTLMSKSVSPRTERYSQSILLTCKHKERSDANRSECESRHTPGHKTVPRHDGVEACFCRLGLTRTCRM